MCHLIENLPIVISARHLLKNISLKLIAWTYDRTLIILTFHIEVLNVFLRSYTIKNIKILIPSKEFGFTLGLKKVMQYIFTELRK